MAKKRQAAVLVRPAYEIAMFGGPDHVEVRVGTMIRVHPAHDLFMQGARYAEVRRVRDADGEVVFDVRPYVGGAPVAGKLRRLSARDVLIDENGIGA